MLELDKDGYPTEDTLEVIRYWPMESFTNLMENLKEIWWSPAPNLGFTLEAPGIYRLSPLGFGGDGEA